MFPLLLKLSSSKAAGLVFGLLEFKSKTSATPQA